MSFPEDRLSLPEKSTALKVNGMRAVLKIPPSPTGGDFLGALWLAFSCLVDFCLGAKTDRRGFANGNAALPDPTTYFDFHPQFVPRGTFQFVPRGTFLNMKDQITLTNILLTGILLVQCFSVVFRSPAAPKRTGNDVRQSNNPPRFP